MVRQNLIETRSQVDVLKEKGLVFPASHTNADVAAGDTTTFRMTNDMENHLIAILKSSHPSNGLVKIDVYLNPTIDSAGTEVTLGNMKAGSGYTPRATYEHSVTFSGGDKQLATIAPGTTGGFMSPPSGAVKGGLIGAAVEPGETLVWEMENLATEPIYMADEFELAEIREGTVSLP